MRFSVANTQDGPPSWWLYGDNGELVAWAGETFANLANAQRAAHAFKGGAVTARYEVYPDRAGQFRWRAWRSSDKVAASGESFASSGNAQRAADHVRASAGRASGP